METGGVFEIEVNLVGVDPPVSRRLHISSSATLAQLHQVLQIAMGWRGYHLHEFEVGDVHFGPVEEDPEFASDEFETLDESLVTLEEVFATVERATYLYDFGDSWEHELLARVADPPAVAGRLARCVDGVRACPPEDCGGPRGYATLLALLADSGHEGRDEVLEWLGGEFDPDAFDRAAVNRRLGRLH